jgi:hypothetical protein
MARKAVVLAAAGQFGQAVQHASAELRANADVVGAAVHRWVWGDARQPQS